MELLIDGDLHVVPYKDMDVSMPIASMRQAVDKGSDMFLTKGGGWLKHKKSGTSIRLHERLGVYFFKMKFLNYNEQLKYQPDSSSPFTRPA